MPAVCVIERYHVFPSVFRRLPAVVLAAALFLAAFPGAVSAAADASVTGRFATLETCAIDSDGLNGDDPCLETDLLEFTITVTNTGDASLTHVQLTAPLTAVGASGPARILAAGVGGTQTGATCTSSGGNLSCFTDALPSGSSLDVVLGFDPIDTPDVYLETVEYRGTATVTAKASTKNGPKANFQRSAELQDSATFLLSAEDADRTHSYQAVDDGQETTLTLPERPAGVFAFLRQLAVSRGDANDFCGNPGLTLGTCFGLAVHVEVETAQGAEYVFEQCDLTSENRAATCLAIEITWDPTDPNVNMPLLYQQLPSLITAYDHGNAVEKCSALIDAGPDDATDPDRSCSTDATIIQSGDRAGWITITIYAASNGNWGAG